MEPNVQDSRHVKTVKLHGWKDETVYERDDTLALPANIMGINFAKMQLSQSTAEWASNERELARSARGAGVNTEWASGIGGTSYSPLSKEDVISCVVDILLKDHCTSTVGLAQAGKLLYEADTRDLDMVTGILAGTDPFKWPPRALAQQTVKVINQILLVCEAGDQGLERDRPFKDEQEVESEVQRIMTACDTILGSKIQSTLKRYFPPESPSVSSSNSDLNMASRLLAFCESEDKDCMSAIISVLGTPRMPFVAISEAISKLVRDHGPELWQTVEGDLRRRFVIRSTHNPFPSARQQESKVKQRARSSSSSRSPPPSAQRIPRSSTPPASISGYGYPEGNGLRRRAVSASGRSSSQKSRLTSPLPEPKRNSVVMRVKRSASVVPGPEETASHSPTTTVEFAYQPTEERVGTTSEKFKWWNMVLDRFRSIQELDLVGAPALGDVLTYWDKSRGEAGAYVYLEDGWTNISQDYYSNTGKIHHPKFPSTSPRILSWKSADSRVPTWVVASTFSSKRKYANDLITTLDDYHRTLTSTTNPAISFNVGDHND